MTKHFSTKRALFASMLSFLLCVSMLVGSTFAWFTDNASTAVNTIQSGIIDIRLVDALTGEDMEGKTLSWMQNGEIAEDILWEPGATFYTQPVRVMNYSNLSFYIDAIVSGFEGDTKLLEAIEFKIVHAYACLPEELGGLGLDFDQCNGRKYVYAGTGTVFTGEGKNGDNIMADSYGIQADWTDQMDDYDNDGELEAGPGVGEPKPLYDLCIIAHMKEEAGNEYQGLTLTGAALTFRATQSPYEYDSYDNQYDKDATFGDVWDGSKDFEGLAANTVDNVVTIETAEQFAAFAANVNENKMEYRGMTVELASDLDLNDIAWTPIGQTGATEFKGVFDGNGYTISNLYINNTDESAHCSTGLFGWIESHGNEGVTVKNVNVDGANVKGHHYVGVIVGYVYGTIENCNVKNATVECTSVNDDANGDKAGVIAGYVGEDADIKGCTAQDSTVSAGRDAGQIVGAAKAACVTDCKATNVTVTANGTSTGANIKNEVIGRVL